MATTTPAHGNATDSSRPSTHRWLESLAPPRLGRGRYNTTRRRLFERVEATLASTGLTRIAHSLGLQGRVSLREHSFCFAGRPRSLRIGFASDLHAGPFTHPEVFRNAAAAMKEFAPDLMLYGGDFVSLDARGLPQFLQPFSELTPRFGSFAVFGNHDLWIDDKSLRRALSGIGIEVLCNANQRLPPPMDDCFVLGIDDPLTGNPDAESAFAGAEGFRLLLSHSPAGLTHLGERHAHLFLAGHTHGGQIALPGGKPIILPRGRINRRYYAGTYSLREDIESFMLVSKGVGCSALPIRLFASSEVHGLTLRWE